MSDTIQTLKKELDDLSRRITVSTAYTSAEAIDSMRLHELCTALAEGRDVSHVDMTHACDDGAKKDIQELAPKLHVVYHSLCNSFYEWMSEEREKLSEAKVTTRNPEGERIKGEIR